MKKLILLLTVFFLFFSCKSVKKQWVKEHFTEKATTTKINTAQDSVFKSEISKLETYVSQIETSVSKNETTSETTSKNETTSVSGSITAEDGKTKSVTIGGTIIKSNGANVTFETNSSKVFTKQFESQINELTKQLLKEQEINKSTQTEVNSLKSELSQIKTELNQIKIAKSKDTKKTGLSFGSWFFLIVVIILGIAIWYFKKQIPFIK